MEKLNEYQGISGRLHEWRNNVKERYDNYREQHTGNIAQIAKNVADTYLKGNVSASQDFSHLHRFKTRLELVRISAAVMGIEFAYAAETAFVSPTLLQIGVEHHHMTLVWAISAFVGFFLCPTLGSMSDRCKLNMGRRRPFILLLSIGVFLGLLLVPNGEDLGYWFGDRYVQNVKSNTTKAEDNTSLKAGHPWGIFYTILGTVLLDFSADACQSPSRAYLLDVCIPDDHAKGLSTFTIMAGLGGFMGYSMGGFNWDETSIGQRFGGHIKAVFTITSFIFIACVTFTVVSFKEMPLWMLVQPKKSHHRTENHEGIDETVFGYGTIDTRESCGIDPIQNKDQMFPSETVVEPNLEEMGTDFIYDTKSNIYEDSNQKVDIDLKENSESIETLSHYLLSIIYMPTSLRMVCLTNLFCWMAHVCYSLYFTDFVGEAVFGGNPKALTGTPEQILYEEGVRFGCWGMAMYSLSCACYSLVIEKLIQRFRAKRVYVGGLAFYCFGMTLMAITRAKMAVIVFSWAAGVMYSTLFTMPYLLVAHYHSLGTFDLDDFGAAKIGSSTRGLGTDVAIVSSMVFLAQFCLSLCMGSIVSLSGTTTSVVTMASFLSFCGAIAATKIMYLDL